MATQAFDHATARLHSGRMFLTPSAPTARAPLQRLAHELRAAGLLGEARAGAANRYQAGAGLFELIAFTGCAVQLGPETNLPPALEIQLEGPFAIPQRRSGRNARAPRCPVCGKALANWRQQLCDSTSVGQPADSEDSLRCEACSALEPGWAWNWGRHAGYGSLFVALEPVFPGEGQPLPKLFVVLEAIGIGRWHHFYVQE